MDLLSIGQMLWSHKRLTIPLLLLTLLAAYYVSEVKPPVYETTSSVLLTNPPTQATKAQIAADPSLQDVDPYNTFTSYGDLQIIANAVIDVIDSPAYQPTLQAAGVGTGYSLALSTDFGNPPIIEITGQGSTARAATSSAQALTTAVQNELTAMQRQAGVNSFYLIKAVTVVQPATAQKSSSGKLRSLVAVIALGILLLFISVSTADAAAKRRRAAGWTGESARVRKKRARKGGSEVVNAEPARIADTVPWHAERVAR